MGATDLPAPPAARPAGGPRSPLSARSFGTHLLIGELIGRGGMSRVYRGWVRDSGQEVAVKVLRDDLASRPEAVHRFVRERELLQTVASPHVVQVHDLVVHGDELGIVMDLVPGGHLRRAVAFPCELGRAAELAAQIADGLAAVHTAGVVHRDLKPENVLVESDPDGAPRLRLTDFGISRLVDSAALTQTQVTGTPGYLSPEIAAGGRVTAAADVYALGIMLYELCTGRQPFTAENPLLLVLAHTRQEPPRPLGMPDELWSLLARMLAKEARGRPAAAEIATELRVLAPALAGLPPCTVPAGPPVETPSEAAVPAGPPATTGQEPGSRSPYGATPPGGARPDGRGRSGYVVLGPDDGSEGHRRGGPGGGYRPAEDLTGQGGGRAARRADEREARRGGLAVSRPVAVGATIGAATVLLLGAVLVTDLFRGSSDPEVELGTPTTSSPSGSTSTLTAELPAEYSAGAAAPRSTASSGRTAAGKPSAGASATASGSSSSTSASPTSAPGTPTLERVARSAEERHSSDRHATLEIGRVAAGGGTVRSITVRWSADGQGGDGRQEVAPRGNGTTAYDVTVNGLVNGTEYTFTAEVCNSGGRCTASPAIRFTPYGAPTVVAPELSRSGTTVTVAAKPVVRNANPGRTVCTVTVTGTPADPDAPTSRTVPSDGGTLVFTGKPLTTYVAVETCATSDVSDGSATSGPVLTGAG